ncbi:VirB3 family type IV secretion system protein [uncultured Treponema sp.]|uniref:VirB3 family type IV secretion system protein n=1 Tax=uncultured Treponema sp. TaxID=162155 RepID=UPI0026346CAF|nr:VirB3 family type IV secretion system protein [uncultured Treponema sp.]
MSLTDFSMPVHKSFQQTDMILGVQKGIFLLLFLVFAVVGYLFGVVVSAVITVVFYVPCLILTKKDPHMLTIALNSLIEPDRLEG